MTAIDALIVRLSQPSSWAGLSALGLVLGYSEPAIAAYTAAAAGVFAFAAILLNEKSA